MPQRFCVPHIWQLISNELFSAHKKSSYITKSGCFIHTAWMIVGLMLWPPPPFHYPQVFYPNVTPLCLSYSSNKGSKLQEQKNYWQSVKWSLNRTDAPHGVRLDMMAAHDGLSGSRTEFYQPLLASRCSLSDEFHWPGGCLWRPECLDPRPAPDLIIFTPAPCDVRSVNSQEWGEGSQIAPSAIKHYTQNRRIWLNHEFTFTVMDSVAQGTLGLARLTQ